jgi:hypothetical protein
MAYAGQGNLNGPLASVGQRLVDSVGRQFIDQGARIFASEIQQQHLARVPAELVPGVPTAYVPPPPRVGLGFDILVALLVMGTVIATIVLLIVQSAF